MKKLCITLALTISMFATNVAHAAEESRSFTFDFTTNDYGLAKLPLVDRWTTETNTLNEVVDCHVQHLEHAVMRNSKSYSGDGVITLTIDRVMGSGFYHKENKGIYFTKNSDDKRGSLWYYKLTFDVPEGYNLVSMKFTCDGYQSVGIWGSDLTYASGNTFYIRHDETESGTRFTDPNHAQLCFRTDRNTDYIKKIEVKYTKVDPNAPDSFDDLEDQKGSIAWNVGGLTDNSLSEPFNFAYEAAGGVAPHSISLPLKALDANGNAVENFDPARASFSVKNTETNEEVNASLAAIKTTSEGALLSIALPGNYTVAMTAAGEGFENYTLPEPLNVNILPADIKFAELTSEALNFTHVFTKYDSQSKTHPAGEYSISLDGIDFFGNHANNELISLSMQPEGWAPQNTWDGIAPKDTPVYMTREEYEEQYHSANHHRIYAAPTAELTSGSLRFTASHAGVYALTASLREDVRPYFDAESVSKTYRVAITPNLHNENIHIMAYVKDQDGNWVETPVALPDPNKEDSWGMVKDEGQNAGWNKQVRLHTDYEGDIYYRITEKVNSDEVTPYSDPLLAADADGASADEHPKAGYTKYEPGTNLDLSNAAQLALYTVSNGLTSNEKLITFDGADVTGVEAIEAAEAGETEWFTVNGLRIAEPQAAGIYIRKRGGESAKVAIRK